jgi:hypothetical protein
MGERARGEERENMGNQSKISLKRKREHLRGKIGSGGNGWLGKGDRIQVPKIVQLIDYRGFIGGIQAISKALPFDSRKCGNERKEKLESWNIYQSIYQSTNPLDKQYAEA